MTLIDPFENPPRVRDGRGGRVRQFKNGLVIHTDYLDDSMGDVWKVSIGLIITPKSTRGRCPRIGNAGIGLRISKSL
eukprot:102737-Pyramimonas_sp.AAC.1